METCISKAAIDIRLRELELLEGRSPGDPVSKRGVRQPPAQSEDAHDIGTASDNELSIRLGDIGARLRAFRMGRGLAPEAVADRLGISRAALYRAEKGKIPKIETLARISNVLEVSLPNLLGVGVECVDTAVAFFERMRQLEERSEAVIGLFGPVSYLVTSEAYDDMLREVLLDTVPSEPVEAEAALRALDLLMTVLRERKARYQKRRIRIVSLISSSDLERFLLHGAVGRHDLAAEVVARRRWQARCEVEHIATLLRHPPAGVQIAIVLQSTPATAFQIFRQPDQSVLAISPFRLGEQPNVSLGVALITSAEEPLRLHEGIADRLWQGALKAQDAAEHIQRLIARYAIRE